MKIKVEVFFMSIALFSLPPIAILDSLVTMIGDRSTAFYSVFRGLDSLQTGSMPCSRDCSNTALSLSSSLLPLN